MKIHSWTSRSYAFLYLYKQSFSGERPRPLLFIYLLLVFSLSSCVLRLVCDLWLWLFLIIYNCFSSSGTDWLDWSKSTPGHISLYHVILSFTLITSTAYIQMYSWLNFISEEKTLWTLIRLLLREQSDLGPYCLHYRPSKCISWRESR